MEYYIGLDVSQRQTAICIVNGKGTRVAEGKALTDPSGIAAWITKHLDPSSLRRSPSKPVR